MWKSFLCGILGVLAVAVPVAAGDATGLLRGGQWMHRLRPNHPRLFLNADMLPALRERAATVAKADFDALKKEVDALPDDAPIIMETSLFDKLPDGRVKLHNPSQQGHTLFRYNGSDQAADAAMLYLLTGEKQYLAKAKAYLKLANYVLVWTANAGIWADLDGNTRIKSLAAWDWIYNDLTPEERRELLMPILDYITQSQPDGSYRFRRTIGSYIDGNYGETSLEWYAGIAAAGAGIDDKRAEKMLRRGAQLFVDMMDYRERTSGGTGLLSSITPGYSFGIYPYSTFHFFHTWKAAFGEDLSERWTQMCNYPVWFEWSAIRLDPSGKMLYWGIGDQEHRDNLFSCTAMYTHLAQTIHFYGASHPDKAELAYALMARLPESQRKVSVRFRNLLPGYSFLPFLLTGFDPRRVAAADPAKIQYGPYFYAPSFGVLFMRSGTGENDTFASFRFGSANINHQHYDELSFIIYKRNFLALDAGSRCETAHHHMYAAQSVAHNTLLIHEEREEVPPFWKAWGYKPDGKTYYNHGGQNTMGKARALALRSTPDFIYAAGDATACYSAKKCRQAVRQFVWLKPDLFVIYDRVSSVRPDQKKEFLLHTQNRPAEIDARTRRAEHDGVLFIRTLLPEKAVLHQEGGPGREFFASGRNWEINDSPDWDKSYRLTGKWTLEISDANPRNRTEFLHVLQAALPGTEQMIETELFQEGGCDGVRLTDPAGTRWELRFNRNGNIGLHLRQTGADGKVIFDGALSGVEKPTAGKTGD